MRRRRAERLVLRAEVALEAGFGDDARACLEEARRLVPGLPEIDAVQQRVDHASELEPTSPPPVVSAFRRNIPAAVSMLLAGGLAAVAGVAVASRSEAIPPAQDFRSLTLPAAKAPDAFRLKAETTGTEGDAAKAAPASVEATRLERAEDRPDVAPAASLPQVRAVLPVTTATAAPPATLRIQDGISVATAGTFVPATLPVSSPAPEATDESAAVRTVLDRYAAAYTALDAAAAARIWPAVNRAALGRAFEDLVSQRISLGSCRLDVRGATARAECAGSATWTPRVGDESPQTEDRRWTFELARAGSAWQIVSARVQNR
jgi:hypothetical protein